MIIVKVAILQPSYIPWKGVFHMIEKCDTFVFYDDVQYDKHSWRNRNKIKTYQGSTWLTIPVLADGNVDESTPINKIKIDQRSKWNSKHLKSMTQSYQKAPFFDQYKSLLKEIYNESPEYLSDLTIPTTRLLAQTLGCNTQFINSSDLDGIAGVKTERLIQILKKVGGTHYISGPAAKDYLDEKLLAENNISLEYMDYHYPEYDQLYGSFDHFVSVLDLLFMKGEKAKDYISRREEATI